MRRFPILMSLAAIVLSGCSAPVPENVLRFGNGAEPQALDPHVVSGVPEHHILSALFEGLVNLDPTTLDPVPGVAESWNVSEDGLTYTFHLRENAMWSNGDPITAQDFLYAWERLLTPELGAVYAYMLHSMKNARAFNQGEIDDFSQVGAKAIDDRTIEVTLEQPTPYFLSLHVHYTWFPLHRPTIEKFDAFSDRASKWPRPENIVNNGPFLFEEWRPNAIIKMTRNPNYWDAASVKLDGVWAYPIDDRQTEERMFRSGELHFTESVPSHKIDGYRADNPDVLRIDPWLGSYFYRINSREEPLSNPGVRRALSYAIDRKSIVEDITQGGQAPGRFFVPPGMLGYYPEEYVQYDPERAKRELAEAGYANGEGIPPIEILYNTDDDHRKIAEAIQSMWKETLGIDATLLNQDWKVYMDSTNTGNYDVARAGWIGDFIDPINFLECFTSSNGNNRTGYSNPDYDALVEQARVTVDLDARNALYAEAEALLMTDMPIIPLYIYTRAYLCETNVRGRSANLIDYISFKSISLDPGTD